VRKLLNINKKPWHRYCALWHRTDDMDDPRSDSISNDAVCSFRQVWNKPR